MRIIAGPCIHENYNLSHQIAKHCLEVCKDYDVDYYFKASYDKANRTHINSDRGVGLYPTLKDFQELKEKLDIKILTDVHSELQIASIMDAWKYSVDVLQIPAFLCRQTDLIQSAAKTGKIVNVKKGQFLAPWDISGILSKTIRAKEIWITERGTSFGYNNLVVDFTGIEYMLRTYNVPIIFDATHSIQKPSKNGEISSGDRTYAAPLIRAAAALGVSNLFVEIHPDPDKSPSDSSNSLYLRDFEAVVKEFVMIHTLCKGFIK